MAGLLGNIAGALGNNLAQHGHALQHQQFVTGIEEQRAARAEKLAQRNREWQQQDLETQRGWQLEDREQAGLLQQQSQQFKAQQGALDNLASQYGSDARDMQNRLHDLSEKIASLDSMSPEQRSASVSQMESVLGSYRSQLEHILHAAQESGVTDRAGLRAVQSYMAQIEAELAEQKAKEEAERQRRSQTAITGEHGHAEQAAALRQLLNRDHGQSSFVQNQSNQFLLDRLPGN